MSKKILLAEDNKLILKTVAKRLSDEGYEVFNVSNGKDCASYIEEKKESIDLIITDLFMPYVNGIELISLTREKLNLNTPILVLSADSNEDSALKAFDLGANDFVLKPFNLNELMIRVKKLLR